MGGKCGWLTESFLRLSDWRLSFASPGWRLQKTSCAWHLIHHKTGKKFEMTWPSDVERGWVGETSTIWFSRRRSTSLWPFFFSPHAKYYPTLNNLSCTGCVSKEMISMLPELKVEMSGAASTTLYLVGLSTIIWYAMKRINMLHLSSSSDNEFVCLSGFKRNLYRTEALIGGVKGNRCVYRECQSKGEKDM